jgi:hypothetical protein
LTLSSGDGAAGQDRLFRIEFYPGDYRSEFLCDWHQSKPSLVGKKGKVCAFSGRDRTLWKAACRASSIALISSPDLTFTTGIGAAGQDRLLRIEFYTCNQRSELFPLSHGNLPPSSQFATAAFRQDGAIMTTFKQD